MTLDELGEKLRIRDVAMYLDFQGSWAVRLMSSSRQVISTGDSILEAVERALKLWDRDPDWAKRG